MRCRAGALGSRPRKSWKRCRSPSRISGGERTVRRAAASSIASGMPSRCRQISPTIRSSPAFAARSGTCAPARSTKSRTESSLVESGPIRHTSSFAKASGLRLVARMPTAGTRPAPRSRVGQWRVARCSQLSRIRSACFAPRGARARRSGRRGSPPDTPSASAIAAATRRPFVAFERSAIQTPSAHSCASRRPSSTARRVLPMPPGPTMVSSPPAPTWPASSSIAIVAADEGCRRCDEVVPVSWHGVHRNRMHQQTATGHDGREGDRLLEVAEAERSDAIDRDLSSLAGGDDCFVGREHEPAICRSDNARVPDAGRARCNRRRGGRPCRCARRCARGWRLPRAMGGP